MAVRVSGVYLENYNMNRNLNPLRPYEVYTIPISRPDPGPDGVNNTSDDTGQTLTYWDYPASYRGASFEGTKLVNDDPKNDSTYKTIEVAATRRLSSGWQFLGSVLSDEETRSICRRFGVDSQRRNQHRR